MADAEKLANYNKILGAACKQGTLVRKTWYSDIYKVMLKVGQTQRYWDVECVSLPLDDDRRKFIIEKCGFSEESLPNFEIAVRESLKNAYTLSKSFVRGSSQEQKDRKDFPVLPYGLLGWEETEDGFEMKIVYECAERFLDCIAPGGEISAIELLNQLGKINGVLKRMHRAGVYAGVVDLDQIYRLSYRVESSSGESAERTATFLGNLLYCRKSDGEFLAPPLFPYCNIPESIKRGEAPTRESDYSSFAMLIISLLNGTYGTSSPDTVHLPEFLTQSEIYRGELIESLLNVRDSGGTHDAGRLANEFFNSCKRIVMNSEAKNIMIRLNTAPLYPGVKREAASAAIAYGHKEEKPIASAPAEKAAVGNSDQGQAEALPVERNEKQKREVPHSEPAAQKGRGRPAEPKNRQDVPPAVRSSPKPSEEPAGRDAVKAPPVSRTAKDAKSDEQTHRKKEKAVRDEITAPKREETDDVPQKTPVKRGRPGKEQPHGFLAKLFGGTEEKKIAAPKQERKKSVPETKKKEPPKKTKKISSAPKTKTEPDDSGPVFEFFEIDE